MPQRIHAPRHLTGEIEAHLRRRSARLRLDQEPHALEVLRLALEALDRADEAREMVAAEGITFENRFGEIRQHPAVAIERDSRLAVARLFRELSLFSGDYVDPRVPRVGGGRR